MRSLIVDADVVAHHALDQQQQNHSAVENGKRQQVQDAQVQADGRRPGRTWATSPHLRRLPAMRAIPTGPESCDTETWCVNSRLSTSTISSGVLGAEFAGLGHRVRNGIGSSRTGVGTGTKPSFQPASSLAGWTTMGGNVAPLRRCSA